jgi:nitrate reductase molybdenum cofactor assembly chaperone NarJ/NarW
MKTLKVLAALLAYPTEDLQAAAGELIETIEREAVLPPPQLRAVAGLIEEIAAGDLYDLQESWLLQFDRTRSLSLHLMEHVHGESRDRGQAMVDLLALYQGAGYTPVTSELPDFLPLFLEFASTRPPADALALVGEPGHVLATLRERLAKRGSPHTAVFDALVSLADVELDADTLAAILAEPDHEPDDLEALDAEWAEEEVTFGPAAVCGAGDLASKLRQSQRRAPGIPVPPRPQTTIRHAGTTLQGEA